MSPDPVLLLCAHGTDDPEGRQVFERLHARVAARAGVRVEPTWVDVQHPQVGEVLDRLVGAGDRVVLVPALLSAGYHTQVDIARAAAAHPGRVVVTEPLGPHPRLADLLHRRLLEAGAHPDDVVVLAAAGSSRPEASRAVERTAVLLAERWGAGVRVGYCASTEPTVAEAVRRARAERAEQSGRVVLSSYLLAPGFFHRRLLAQGTELVSEPLGAEDEVVDVVLDRYRSALPRPEVEGF